MMNQNKSQVLKIPKMNQFIEIINILMMIQWDLYKNVINLDLYMYN